MKPNGLVFAASITSQTSMSSLRHINAISFTRPMLTARNVFSSSFTISATRARSHRHDVIDNLSIQRGGHVRRLLIDTTTTDDFRDRASAKRRVGRIDALGRKRQVEICPGAESARFE